MKKKGITWHFRSMTPKKDDRKFAQRKHFRRRVLERLGYALSEHVIEQIKISIEDGTLQGEQSQIPRLTIYKIFVDSRPCVVLYDNVTQELVTFLTLSMWQEREMRQNSDQPLRVTLEQSSAGEVLKKLKEKL